MIASLAVMAKVGHIVQIHVAETAALYHGWKDGAQALAISAGIADLHDAASGIASCHFRGFDGVLNGSSGQNGT